MCSSDLVRESLNMDIMQKAAEMISKCEVLIVAGTSLVVYPAASFLRYYRGNKLMIINRDHTSKDEMADYVIHDDLNEVMDELAKEL